ncbi:MAG: acylase [Leptothrix sp. (in: Bacteria)]|nr:acylase [Leptothrix sp. (in: b-proteobacteria)]
MPDGTRLAASLYRPRGAAGPLPTILVREPYGRLHHGEALRSASLAKFGYAVLVQDLRGKFDSEGQFATWEMATDDGVATLDWIVKQPWSNGKVGTYGCSALGEVQYSLARARHPAHKVMIASGAGGGIGSAMGSREAFGWFEGGIFQLAGGFGWFQENGNRDKNAPVAKQVDHAAALLSLPLIDMLRRVQPGANGFEDFLTIPLGDPRWERNDFVSEGDHLTTPALAINTWGDQTLQATLDLVDFTKAGQPASQVPPQHVIIAPGNHCEHLSLADSDHFGEVEVHNTKQPYTLWFRRLFDHYLKGEGPGLSDLPPYLYYVVGENRWLEAKQWPPEQAQVQRWFLSGQGRANSVKGDGALLPEVAAASAPEAADQYRYDPAKPVPSRGGPICCTGNPQDKAGLVNQRDVESRDDVLVYTSAPLAKPMRIAGPLNARLVVSSSALDTDFVARLVHVRPDGTATNIQEGALRARYREGLTRPALMKPGQRYELTVRMRSMAYLIPKGHRIRLDITSSSFPRLERNLNTGGRNYDESVGVVAVNTVHHGGTVRSFVELPVLDTPDIVEGK